MWVAVTMLSVVLTVCDMYKWCVKEGESRQEMQKGVRHTLTDMREEREREERGERERDQIRGWDWTE